VTRWWGQASGRRVDVPEWEYDFPADLAPNLVHPFPWGRPYRPSRLGDVPQCLLSALIEAVGPVAAWDLFVVPATTRPAPARRCVYTPTRVLGLGARAVGLCVDGLPEPRILDAVPYGEVTAIVENHDPVGHTLDVHAGLAGVTLPYHPCGGHPLAQLLTRLRSRLTGEPAPVPPVWPDPTRLPPCWRTVVGRTTVQLVHSEPVAGVFDRFPGARRGRARCCLVALTPQELIVVSGPEEIGRRGRSERLYVARPRIRQVLLGADALQVHIGKTVLSRPVPPGMVAALRGMLSAAVTTR
jgi:hypothetical protein